METEISFEYEMDIEGYDPTLNIKPLLRSVEVLDEEVTILRRKSYNDGNDDGDDIKRGRTVSKMSKESVILYLVALVEKFEEKAQRGEVKWLDDEIVKNIGLGICVLVTIKNLDHYCRIKAILDKEIFVLDSLFNKEKSKRWFIITESDGLKTTHHSKEIKEKGLRVLEKHRRIDKELFEELRIMSRGESKKDNNKSESKDKIKILFNMFGDHRNVYRGLEIELL